MEDFKEFCLSEFAWFRLILFSRIFEIYVEGIETDALIPYADMFNHKDGSPTI